MSALSKKIYNIFHNNKNSNSLVEQNKLNDEAKKIKIDVQLLKDIFKIVKKAIPSFFSKETFCIILLSILLIVRTQMSIQISEISGKIVKAIVTQDYNHFIKQVKDIFYKIYI